MLKQYGLEGPNTGSHPNKAAITVVREFVHFIERSKKGLLCIPKSYYLLDCQNCTNYLHKGKSASSVKDQGTLNQGVSIVKQY